MDENTRTVTNHMTALQGEHPHTLTPTPIPAAELVRGYHVRRVSIESLAVLQLVGSPYAAAYTAALNGEQAKQVRPGPADTAIFVWAHAEDPDKVLEIATQCTPEFADDAKVAALRFVRGWSIADASKVAAIAMGEATALQAAAFESEAPDYGQGTKKNN